MIFYLLLGASLLIYTAVQDTALKKRLNALEDHRPHSSDVQYCCKAHSEVNGKMENLIPVKS